MEQIEKNRWLNKHTFICTYKEDNVPQLSRRLEGGELKNNSDSELRVMSWYTCWPG